MKNDISAEIRRFIFSWDGRFPIDRWWRQKHNVPFNSPTHRESNFIDMYMEFLEDNILIKNRGKEEYIPGTGNNFIKKVEVSQEDYLQKMADFDYSQFDDKE